MTSFEGEGRRRLGEEEMTTEPRAKRLGRRAEQRNNGDKEQEDEEESEDDEVVVVRRRWRQFQSMAGIGSLQMLSRELSSSFLLTLTNHEHGQHLERRR